MTTACHDYELLYCYTMTFITEASLKMRTQRNFMIIVVLVYTYMIFITERHVMIFVLLLYDIY